jgi:hypothetical protein
VDEVTLTIPRERPFSAVAGLVVGGVAARHDVTIDVLDDLQLGLDALLDHADTDEGEVTVVVRVGDGAITATIGPLPEDTLGELEQDLDEGIGLRRLLETVVDDVALLQEDGEARVELRKAFAGTVAP